MDGATLITSVLSDLYGIDSTEQEYANFRAKTKRNGQRAIDFVWTFKPWDRRYVPSATATIVPATDPFSVALPSDFNSFGKSGSVVMPELRRELFWRPLRDILLLINGTAHRDEPEWYSTGDVSAAGIQKLYVYPGPNVDRLLKFPYERKSPTLIDGPSPSGMEEFPVSYHETVIREGTVMYEFRDRGDLREAKQEATFMRNLIGMARDLLPGSEAPGKFPVYPGARRHYGYLNRR